MWNLTFCRGDCSRCSVERRVSRTPSSKALSRDASSLALDEVEGRVALASTEIPLVEPMDTYRVRRTRKGAVGKLLGGDR